MSNASVIPIDSLSERSARIPSLDWVRISRELDAYGNAVLGRLLSPEECLEIAALYSKDDLFRSKVVNTSTSSILCPNCLRRYAQRCIRIWLQSRIDGIRRWAST